MAVVWSTVHSLYCFVVLYMWSGGVGGGIGRWITLCNTM